MPRQDKGKRRDNQRRQLAHVEEGYAEHGLPDEEAERRAWATVNDVRYTADTLGGGYREADDVDRSDAPCSSSHINRRWRAE